jgi:hypothetical protein
VLALLAQKHSPRPWRELKRSSANCRRLLALLEGWCASKAKALARTQALERELQALQDAQTKGAEANKWSAEGSGANCSGANSLSLSLSLSLQALQDAQTKGAEANKGTTDYEAALADMAQKLSACQVNPWFTCFT